MIDFKNFHIPMPSFEPTLDEKKWVIDNIWPNVEPAIDKITSFERVDLNQTLFEKWTFTQKILNHFTELDIKFHKFSIFLTARNPQRTSPHIDATGDGNARVSRFNIPISGINDVYIEWWDKDKNAPEVQVREFKEFRFGSLVDAIGFTTSKVTDPAVYRVDNPGPCWNRTEKLHRLGVENIKEQRIVITAQLPNNYQISWDDLVCRLTKLGYL